MCIVRLRYSPQICVFLRAVVESDNFNFSVVEVFILWIFLSIIYALFILMMCILFYSLSNDFHFSWGLKLEYLETLIGSYYKQVDGYCWFLFLKAKDMESFIQKLTEMKLSFQKILWLLTQERKKYTIGIFQCFCLTLFSLAFSSLEFMIHVHLYTFTSLISVKFYNRG